MARGIQAMQQAVKNIAGGGGRGGRGFNYFNLEDGQDVILRFLTDTDEIVTCDFYEYVKTRVKDKEGKWTDGTNSFIVAPDYWAGEDEAPAKVDDWVAKYGGKVVDYNTKELVDPKPKERRVAIAVERERVPVEGGKGANKFKHQDKFVEITYKDKDGNEQTALGRNFILIRKDAKTFWGNVVGYHGEFETLIDRDYKITRNGKLRATNYAGIPVGPADEWEDLEAFTKELHARYGYGTGKDHQGNDLDKDSEERFLYCPSTLKEWCDDQAREDRVKSLLLGERDESNVKAETNGSSNGKAPAPADDGDEAQAAPSPSKGDVSDLRAKLEAHK